MTVEYHIDIELRVVFLRECGVVTFAGSREARRRIAREPAFGADFNQLVDCRGVALMDLTAGEIRELAARSVTECRGRLAVVVATSEQYGVSRMLAAHRDFAGGTEMLIVWQLAEALDWLGLPPDGGFLGAKSDGKALATA